MSTTDKILVRLNGGLGKVLAMTAALRQLRKANPLARIHVLTGHPEALEGLPFVDRFYGLPRQGEPMPAYFAEEHRGFRLFFAEPYERDGFRSGHEHLISETCRAWGIDEPPEAERHGVIRISDGEHNTAMAMLRQVDRSKPWVAFQPWGSTHLGNPLIRNQIRDIPQDIAQGIVDALVARGAIVIQVSTPMEPALKGAIFLGPEQKEGQPPQILPVRLWFAILKQCEWFVGIDSFAQHAWAALGKPTGRSVVCWGATRPESFGYACHRDLWKTDCCPTPGCMRPDLTLPDLVGRDASWRCHYDGACMAAHHVEDVVAALGLPERAADPPQKKEAAAAA